jgi:hypothetical protein
MAEPVSLRGVCICVLHADWIRIRRASMEKKRRRRMRTYTSQTTDAALQQQSVSACHSKRDFCANTGTQTTPTYEINEEVVMKVKTQKKTMFMKFLVAASKQSGGKWVYQLKAKDGTLHDGGAWCAQRELAYP